MNKENLIKILLDLKEVRTKTLTKVSDDTLWDTSIRVYNSEAISEKQGKFERTKPPFSPAPIPATKEQKDLLYDLDVDVNTEKLTKQEAQSLISKTLKERKEKKK